MHRKTTPLVLTGHGISPGLGRGRSYVYHDLVQRVECVYCLRTDEEVDREYGRLEEAIGNVLRDLKASEEEVERVLDEDFAQIFRAHRQILQDPSLLGEMRATIERNRVNAECVVSVVFRRLETKFRQLRGSRAADRADDVGDLAGRVLRSLAGQPAPALEALPPDLEALPQKSVIVAKRLLPSDTVHFSKESVSGVIVEEGGSAGHAAILTRELGIPAVSGIVNATERVREGQTVLVDGTEGTVVVKPDEAVEAVFRRQQARISMRQTRACEHSGKPACTGDGTAVAVLANISCREDAVLAREKGAEGVGLCRTEHLYFGRETLPGEDDLVNSLREIVAPFAAEVPVTLRLLDTGGDKPLPFLNSPAEFTPVLGRRGVRFLLDYPELLLAQLRSFIRLSEERAVRVLVPMVTLASDMLAVRELYERAALELRCDRPPPLGSMIETPAAALCTASIAEVSHFLSAGTNDLTQYTMAAGRENAQVADYFLQDHPAIFRLLAEMIHAAGETPTGICGELAGDPESLPALVKLGFREISVNPLRIPRVKELIREVNLEGYEPGGEQGGARPIPIGDRTTPRAPP